MGKKKKRKAYEQAQLEMTPMIDVVFQLLIFFIFTLKQEDILAHLDVNRPAPETTTPPEKMDELFNVLVYKDGYVFQGRKVPLRELERQLSKQGSINKGVAVIIKCTNDSPHSLLVQLLDICAKVGLTNLSVFSM